MSRRFAPGPWRKVRDFVKNAYQRRRYPERFIQKDSTPYEEIHRDGIMAVRYYRPLAVDHLYIEGETLVVRQQRYTRPLVLVPPLGVFAWIFDLMIERSLVRYLLAQGYEVYLIDWGNPKDPPYQGLTLEDYVVRWFPAAMQAIRAHSGQRQLNLMGYCMGGLLALLYLGCGDDRDVTALVTIASPLDARRMGVAGRLSQAIAAPSAWIRAHTRFRLDQIDAERFHVPGKWVSRAFKMTSPLSPFTSYLSMVRNLADREYIVRYMSMNAWFDNMADYPGGTVQEMLQKLGLANQLARGSLRIGQREVDFQRIDCDLLAFAGSSDAIVPMAAAYRIMDLVASRDKRFHLVPGGHAGVFAGASAVHTTWAISAEWLAERSGALQPEASA